MTPLCSETIFVDDLLAAFSANTNNQMAILWWMIGVAGLVTFEESLEEIVGEIDDETDKASVEDSWNRREYLYCWGAVTLNDNEHFDWLGSDVDTIAGYYLTVWEQFPQKSREEHYEVILKDKHLEFINDKVGMIKVTKQVIITSAPESRRMVQL